MERILQILAAAFLIAAAYFLWRDVADWSFVCGVLAACSFFLAMRFQIKARVAERAAAEAEEYPDDQHVLPEPAPETPNERLDETPANSTLHS